MMRVYSKLFDLKRTAILSARIFILAVALTAVTVAGNAKTSGGSIAATTMMAIEKNNREAAQRARLLAPAPTDRCSMCHTEIMPFTLLPVFPDKTFFGHNVTEPNPEWKQEDEASIQWHNGDNRISFVRIKILTRDKDKLKRIYALEVPYQPTRFYLPAEEGTESLHKVLEE